MHTLLVLATIAFAKGSPSEAEEWPPASEEVAYPRLLDARATTAPEWEWLPSDGVTPGRWITYPPMEFAIDLVGAEAVQRCALTLTKESKAACALQLSPCQRLVLPSTGALRLELDTACMVRELPKPSFSPRSEPPAPDRQTAPGQKT